MLLLFIHTVDCLHVAVMLLCNEKGWRLSPNWSKSGIISILSSYCGNYHVTRREKRVKNTDRQHKKMKFTLRGGIFNTWPHYGEWAQRCVSALLAFALTMFILENDMIFGWHSWPTFCCDIHTVKFRHWINNSHTYYIATPWFSTFSFLLSLNSFSLKSYVLSKIISKCSHNSWVLFKTLH